MRHIGVEPSVITGGNNVMTRCDWTPRQKLPARLWRMTVADETPDFISSKDRCRRGTGQSRLFQASRTDESGTDKKRRLPRLIHGFPYTGQECSVRRGQRSGTAECDSG